ncbi:MAG: NAD(P)-dependent alcohol dehydrogenase [Alphaproteobacteria bacterium]|nr:NAD(P)-dependent alcohol dehydrogenase [Alphaproteobacteria bacterium]
MPPNIFFSTRPGVPARWVRIRSARSGSYGKRPPRASRPASPRIPPRSRRTHATRYAGACPGDSVPKRWHLSEFGLAHLACVEVDPVPPGPGEVRLRMRAVSLNYRDLLMVRGHYDPRVPRPLVPCSDGVGVVEAVGPGVEARPGERRIPIFAQGWLAGPPRAEHLRTTLGGPLPGTLQTHLVVPYAATVPAPTGLSDAEAATLPCAGVTAWHALEACGVTAGSTVATLGTGGVSIFALQLARAMGARVAITSSSPAKLDRARALGAEHTVDYRATPDWGREIARWAGDSGVDAVIEVGGAGTIGESLRAVRVGGTLALIGVLDGGAGDVPLVKALMRSVRIQGVLVGSRDHFEALSKVVTSSGIRPVVDRVFPFDEAPMAFEHLASGAHFGKVVVTLPEDA